MPLVPQEAVHQKSDVFLWQGSHGCQEGQKSQILGEYIPRREGAPEYVGCPVAGLAIEEARAAEGKRRAQKYETPAILEKVPAERMTFSELIEQSVDQNVDQT